MDVQYNVLRSRYNLFHSTQVTFMIAQDGRYFYPLLYPSCPFLSVFTDRYYEVTSYGYADTSHLRGHTGKVRMDILDYCLLYINLEHFLG